ncbi:MAG: pilus assembly protein TadG-related protein [Planctomycetota bacterium]|nr:pilus assembly protein TadG-related protein [Planctomycetota bacterium]
MILRSLTARRRRRRGVATVWLIAAAPALLVLLALVTEIGNVWLARIELGNAVEAGALAGAKAWGDAGTDTAAARVIALASALEFTNANWVHRQPPVTPDVVFGSFDAGVFTPAPPAITIGQFACRVNATANVNPLWAGTTVFCTKTVQNSATAWYSAPVPRLVHVNP